MTAAAALWLVFSTLGGIPVAKAPPVCAVLLDEGLIRHAVQGKTPCYCIAPAGYNRIVRL